MDDLRTCTRCVMDTTDPQIVFDRHGYCNHCTDFLSMLANHRRSSSNNESTLTKYLNGVRRDGRGKEYDCVIGISGGVDSTYLAYLSVKKFGLRPLAVHLDNGWNAKLAVKNISQIIRKLDIDLHTHVIDWEEFKQLQLAYLRASVIDIEVPTDHAIRAILYRTAKEHGIQHVLRGYNRHTEGIIPKSWTFNKQDLENLLDIQRQFGTGSLSTYPMMGAAEIRSLERSRKVRSFAPLNYMPYDDAEVRKLITSELGWADYGGKHHESVFTRFYQGYILPRKFGIDKRKAHYSTAICNGEITRAEAIEKLKMPTYDPDLQEQDYNFVVKKFDFTVAEFEQIMILSPRSHFEFKTEFHSRLRKIYLNPRNPVYRFLKRLKTLH